MIFQYVSAGLVMLILGLYAIMNNTISSLRLEVTNVRAELAVALHRNSIKDINLRDMNRSISVQNTKIQSIKVDYEAKILEYKNRKPDVVYKTIVKTAPVDTNITRGNCEDTKNIINAISTIDFNSL